MRVESVGCREIDEINQRLADIYGVDVSLSKPNYRIAWTTHQFEPRYGTWEDYSPTGGFYLRTVTETRVTFKYPLFEDMWVLERIQGNNSNPELKVKWSYEPLWIYGANNSDPNPDWEHTNQLVHSNLFIREHQNRLSEKDMQEIENKRFEKEKKLCKSIIQDNSEFLVNKLVVGEAVSVPHNFKGADSDVK